MDSLFWKLLFVVITGALAFGAPTQDDAVARLYELRALGYVERHSDGWKLTRQTMISARGGRSPR